MIYVGTTSWDIPKIAAGAFPKEGEPLLRYADRLNAIEIDNSFYQDIPGSTYKEWAEKTPDHFRFSVKLHKRFTHECDLNIDRADLIASVAEIMHLGPKLGALLIQLPAGQKFYVERMERFYSAIRSLYHGPLVLEPRNLTWMFRDSIRLMKKYRITKVIADPEKCPGELESELAYYRLHGSPDIYSSDYSHYYLDELVLELENTTTDAWCIFDNTTFGYATLNALAVLEKGGFYESHQRIYDSRRPDVHPPNQY